MKEAFQHFDEDGGGTIDTAELVHAMTKIGQKLTQKQAEDFVREADVNGDGEIELTVHCTRTGLSEITLPQKYVGKLLGTNADGKRGIAIGINPVLSLSTYLTPTPL